MAARPQQFALPQADYCCQGMNHSGKICYPCVNTPARSYRVAAAVKTNSSWMQHRHDLLIPAVQFGCKLRNRRSPVASSLCHAAVWIIVHSKQDKLSGVKLCKHCQRAAMVLGIVDPASIQYTFMGATMLEISSVPVQCYRCFTRSMKGIHWQHYACAQS